MTAALFWASPSLRSAVAFVTFRSAALTSNCSYLYKLAASTSFVFILSAARDAEFYKAIIPEAVELALVTVVFAI